MTHKAFALDWAGFRSGLLPLLLNALESDCVEGLLEFISANPCTNPDEGTPLDPDWQLNFASDVQALADVALTAYYNPQSDFGLGPDWLHVQQEAPENISLALLGAPVVAGQRSFDPGRMGSYFQSPQQVAESIRLLSNATEQHVSTFTSMLTRVSASGKGLYVTF